MKPPPFEYFAPTTLAEAVHLLSESDNARLLAGGQSLMAMLNMRYVFPDRIIDLNRVAELDFIREENDEIVIGAMTRQWTLQRAPQIGARAPIILRYVGHLQTRNRGTLGGSLCQLDPAAELPAVAMAYDAVVEAIGPNGTRSILFVEFPSMFMTSSLAPDEILTAMRLKPGPVRSERVFANSQDVTAISPSPARLRSCVPLLIKPSSGPRSRCLVSRRRLFARVKQKPC